MDLGKLGIDLLKKFEKTASEMVATAKSCDTKTPAVQDEDNIYTMTVDETGKNSSIQPRSSSASVKAMQQAEQFLEMVYGDEASETELASAKEIALRSQNNFKVNLPEINTYDPQRTWDSTLSGLTQFKTKDGAKEVTIQLEDMLNSGLDYNAYVEQKLFELYGQENNDTDNDGTATDSDFGLAMAEMLKESNPKLESEAHGKSTWEAVSDSIVMSAFENGYITLNVRDIGISYTNMQDSANPLANYTKDGEFEVSHIYSMADSITIPDVDGEAVLSGENILENFEYNLEGLGQNQKKNIELMILQQVAASNGLLDSEEYMAAKNDLNALKALNFAQGKEIGATLITEDVNVAVQKDIPTRTLINTQTLTNTITNTTTNNVTQTVTNTATQTVNNTTTQTVTNTTTNNVTQTITNNTTQTVTNTATQTVTNTATQTVTNTTTNNVTQTVTNTATQTVTNTATQTITNTATQTVTNTTTQTVTNNVTHTVTNTTTVTCTPNPEPNF